MSNVIFLADSKSSSTRLQKSAQVAELDDQIPKLPPIVIVRVKLRIVPELHIVCYHRTRVQSILTCSSE